ncbi:hypothetical protein NPN23_23905, partial [Vibrio parahaemolyticus]|nr:hypothetical protein [Vibrio parahaemolyticus]
FAASTPRVTNAADFDAQPARALPDELAIPPLVMNITNLPVQSQTKKPPKSIRRTALFIDKSKGTMFRHARWR